MHGFSHQEKVENSETKNDWWKPKWLVFSHNINNLDYFH